MTNATSLEEIAGALDTAWVLMTATFIILMQLGFAMLEAGTVREHNVIATYAKNVLDFVLGIFVSSAFGFAIAYGRHPMALKFDDSGHREYVFYVAFQATAATIVSGAMAERTGILAYALVACLTAGVVYSTGVRWTWGGGWLHELGFHDFAGSGVVHLVGGSAAVVGAAVVGPRSGRWDAALAGTFVPHNIPSVMGGTLLLWVGWYSFNAGSTASMSTTASAKAASLAAMVTTISAASAALVILCTSLVRSRGRLVDILALTNGILGGLVAITAGCDVIDPPGAALTGLLSGVVYMTASATISRLRIDDCVEAFAVHGANGIWGCLAVAFFHRGDGLILGSNSSVRLLGVQALGVCSLAALAALPTLVITLAMRHFGVLRVSREEEEKGLDAKFGLKAYTTRSEALQKCSGVAQLLRADGYSPLQMLEALASLRTIIYRPFTPQAADHKLEGEVRDILIHLNFEMQDCEHLAFISHHKADAGDAARIFCDTARRILEVDPSLRGKGKLPKQMFFLDSMGLKDLDKLLNYVASSANHILMLSREVLQRPWCLAELCAAHVNHSNLCVLLIEYPGKHNDPKAFHFPEDLEKAIADWATYISHDTKPARPKPRESLRRAANLVRRVSSPKKTRYRAEVAAERSEGAAERSERSLSEEVSMISDRSLRQEKGEEIADTCEEGPAQIGTGRGDGKCDIDLHC
eukprot:CAMPEP_0119319740 /NCGR_PEP_ID=MMETSP1333-20130426/50209_1 /TAXON_ID=418940 /ORGANISM="Scyphosphaera apsteinii, Strain RCC1455" /LENGTH=697 /DNA_ID=CAMNT_0007326225 /DNA_START=167 /DNA_END=2260 /DNA_ORIENTATION=+